eukprot:m.120616 g.120616  ORF g.120616 m.120616 type:complete len:254 (-) comp15616_c0_seq3:791-1552(-)
MVDYSKWDNLQLSSDDEDDERTGPQVYRVEEGQSVTIPGRNVTINGEQPKVQEVSEEEARAIQAQQASNAMQSGRTVVSSTDATTLTAAERQFQRFTRNGSATDYYYWCQDAETITVSIFVPQKTKSRDVTVAVNDGDPAQLKLDLQENNVFSRTLSAPIAPLDDDDDIDWELVDDASATQPRRLLRVTLRKKDLGMVLWWKAAFKGDPEVSPEKLVDRSAQQQQKSESFMEAFAAAQAEFKRRAKTREKLPV